MRHPRMMLRTTLVGLVGMSVLVLPTLASAVNAGSPTPKPHIVATPNNVMVNSKVKLVGTHFPASTKLVLKECGAQSWIAPQNPCNKMKIRVTTNKHGRFTRTFDVKLCPRLHTWPGHPITEERCYVGEIMPSGVDVIDLLGHVKIIVTYP